MQASSLSKTRAGPVCVRRSVPETLTTAPSGARLPRSPSQPARRLVRRGAGERRPRRRAPARRRRPRRACRPSTTGASPSMRPARDQLADQHGDAAGLVQVGGDVAPAGREVARSPACRRASNSSSSVSSHPGLAGDREQVQDAVGRAAAGARSRPSRSAATARRGTPRAGGRRRRAARRARPPRPLARSRCSSSSAATIVLPGSGEPEELDREPHRVGGEVPGAGARPGAGAALQRRPAPRARAAPWRRAPTASQTSWIVAGCPRQCPARIGPL